MALLVTSSLPALAVWRLGQRHGSQPQQQSAPSQHNQNSPQASQNPSLHLNGPGPHRGEWLRKYMTLPPHQQEQQLQHDPSFKSLPPQKQNQLMDRLRQFNSRPPDQKAQILNRMETFEHMTPQQQAAARSLYDRYRTLPEDQRSQVSQAYRRLRGMPPSARHELLDSEEFQNNYNEEQRAILRGMSDLNVAPGK
jgi:hypothetical protein